MSDHISCPKCNHSFPLAEGLGEELQAAYKAQISEELHNEKIIEIRQAEQAAVKEARAEALKKWEKENQEKVALEAKIQEINSEKRNIEETLNNRVQQAATLARQEMAAQKDTQLAAKQLENERLLNELEKINRSGRQGSMELQGEASEKNIEKQLMENFPDDLVKEIPKGKKGADCLLSIQESGREIGGILFESKDTKNFLNEWTKKLKNDQADVNAAFGVIVTTAWPKNAEHEGFHKRDGVYICRPWEFLTIAVILRDTIKKLASAADLQSRRSDVQSRLFEYFSGPQFEVEFRRIFEPLRDMQIALLKEKTANAKALKKREEQLNQMALSAVEFYGTLSGIHAGIPTIDILELEE